MWQIKCDDLILHDDNFQEKYRLHDIQLELEVNQLNSFDFTIYPDHPHYSKLKKLKSIITVYREDTLMFRGRILDYELGFRNQMQVSCEGELAFLLDSIVRPYEHTGSPSAYLQLLIERHNEQMVDSPEKQFVLGQVTVAEGSNIIRSSTQYPSTWAEIGEKLINGLGGYIMVDEDESGNRRINYIEEDEFRLSSQEINFGENLIDLKTTSKGSEVITAILPLGGKAEGSETRLDIKSLADGIIASTSDDIIRKKGDYIYSETGVATYGFILKTQIYEDVKENVRHLMNVAIETLNDSKKGIDSIELNALDISSLKLNINAFNIHTMTKMTSLKHSINGELFPVTKLVLNLLNPKSNKLTLRKAYSSFTERSAGVNKNQQNEQGRIENVENNVSGLEQKIRANELAIAETTEELSSLINQTADEIMTQVSEKHYLKDETNSLISNVETQVKQTNSEVEIRFNNFIQSIEDLQNGTDAQFTNISKYIRFKDGNILLGEEGNELILKIQNDRISFLESNTEVAYFSNRKLYVLDGEFLNQLRLGNFAFIPRSNGNVSFKKVT